MMDKQKFNSLQVNRLPQSTPSPLYSNSLTKTEFPLTLINNQVEKGWE